jgi:hypothetical protein
VALASVEDRSEPEARQDLIFGFMHFVVGAGGSIVIPAEVQDSVEGVEEQLVLKLGTLNFRAAARLGDVDYYFT